jgi:glucokinase
MPRSRVEEHFLVGDIGGTHTRIAILAHCRAKRFIIVCQGTFPSRSVRNFPKLFGDFLRVYSGKRLPRIRRACVAFAGPAGPSQAEAWITNLDRGFSASEMKSATGIEQLSLLNDFEAVGFGLDVLLASRREVFVKLSRWGRLPPAKGIRHTAVLIGAGTGLGTAILTRDDATGIIKPIPGEGGHNDFVAVDAVEYRIAQWIRLHKNRSPEMPLECEKVVSGPGLSNVYEALGELEPKLGRPAIRRQVAKADDYKRPGIIVTHAGKDDLCRKTLDVWLRCYAREAKNRAIFPLAQDGIFLAGGIAAKVLTELQSGIFMREFTRCDAANIRAILRRTPVFVVTDTRIGLYGCANFAINARS